MNLDIDLNLFATVTTFTMPPKAAQHNNRLTRVLLEPCATAGVVMIASDGQVLMMARDPNGRLDARVTLNVAPGTLTKRRVEGRLMWVDPVGGLPGGPIAKYRGGTPAAHGLTGLTAHGPDYPDWRAMLPMWLSPAPWLGFCVQHLQRIEAAAARLGARDRGACQVYPTGPDSAALVRAPDLLEVAWLLMPRRTQPLRHAPEWLEYYGDNA